MNLRNVGSNYSWQLAKAATAFVTVVIYSRVLGAHNRGELSLMLLYLQLALMINELVVGSVMANWFSKFDFRYLTRRLWWVSGTVLGLLGIVGFWGFNWGYTTFPIVILGATLVRQNMVINLLQSKDLILLRNRWQFYYEFLKLVFLLLGLLFLGWIFFVVSHSYHSDSSAPKNIIQRWVQYVFENEWSPVSFILWILAISGLIWCWLSGRFLKNVLQDSAVKMDVQPMMQEPIALPPKQKFGWFEIKEGVLAQLGHLMLFLIYRMPVFMCSAWMLKIWGYNSQIIPLGFQGYVDFSKLAGVLSNVLLIADTLWIFSNSLGGMVHARLLQTEMLIRSEVSQNRWIWRFFVLSAVGTMLLIAFTALLPSALYKMIFGPDFAHMSVYFIWMIPGVLALGISAVLGHVLHARNQFMNLLWNHALGFFTMMTFWYVAQKSNWLSELDFARYLLFGFNLGITVVMLMNFFSMGYDFRKRIKTPRNILITLQLLIRFIQNRTH